jgi:ubiquinone/menaquinone biosynthesis C-methylase UbiE
LGSGRKLIDKTIPLDADRGWHAPNLDGYTDGTIGGVYAIHFLEHLTKDELMMMLREIERVLMPGGSLITVLPLAGSEISFQDLDHKTFWTEGTWSNLLDNGYYDGTMPREWKFKLHLNIIMGLVQRNLVLISQLVKEERQ